MCTQVDKQLKIAQNHQKTPFLPTTLSNTIFDSISDQSRDKGDSSYEDSIKVA